MKKLLICLLLVLLLTSCSANTTSQPQDQSISIIYNAEIMNKGILSFVETQARQYTQATGIEVVFEPISGLPMDEFNTKLDSKLNFENGPSLYLASPENVFYWKTKPFYDASTLDNYDSILDPLKSKTYIPFTIYMESVYINKKIMDKYNFSPENMTSEKFIELKKLYRSDNPAEMDPLHYRDLYEHYFDNIDLINLDTNSINLTNDKILDTINLLKDDVNSDRYTHPYFDTLADVREYLSRDAANKAYSMRFKNSEEFLLMPIYPKTYNSLNLKSDIEYTNDRKYIIIPNYKRRNRIRFYGFVINPNGKNIEQAKGLIDQFLNKEVQMNIFDLGGGSNLNLAPVISGLETEKAAYYEKNYIDEHIIDISDKVHDRLLDGHYDIYYNTADTFDAGKVLYEAVLTYIFTDNYTTEELINDLEKAEDRLNLYR